MRRPGQVLRGSSSSSTPGTSPTRTARTSSTSTSGTCARRSTGRSAPIDRDRARRRLPAARGRRGVSRLPIRVRLTLAFALAMAVVLVLRASSSTAASPVTQPAALDQRLRSRAQDVSARVAAGARCSRRAAHSSSTASRSPSCSARAEGVVDSSSTTGGSEHCSVVGVDTSTAPGDSHQPPVGSRTWIEPARLLALPVVRGSSKLVLIVGATRENRAETFAQPPKRVPHRRVPCADPRIACRLWGSPVQRCVRSRRCGDAKRTISATSLDDRSPGPAHAGRGRRWLRARGRRVHGRRPGDPVR